MADDEEPSSDDLACVELVDTLTEYIDGDVDEGERARLEHHLEGCEGCDAALDQFQTVIRVAGRLKAADVERVDSLVRDRLMAALRVMRRR